MSSRKQVKAFKKPKNLLSKKNKDLGAEIGIGVLSFLGGTALGSLIPGNKKAVNNTENNFEETLTLNKDGVREIFQFKTQVKENKESLANYIKETVKVSRQVGEVKIAVNKLESDLKVILAKNKDLENEINSFY